MLMVKRLAGPSVQYDKVRLYPAEPFQIQFGLVNMRKVKFPVDPVMQMLCFGFEFLSARVCLMLLQPLLRIEIVRKYMRLDEGFPIIRKRIVDYIRYKTKCSVSIVAAWKEKARIRFVESYDTGQIRKNVL